MTNFEKYENEIKTVTNDGKDFAFDTETKEISRCENTPCTNCLFMPKIGEHCGANKANWLYEEYKEPLHIELTPFAKALLERAAEKGFQYITRSKTLERIMLYESKPTLEICAHESYWCGGKTALELPPFFDDFPFIKKTDTEPWHIATLLKRNEV